jgi:hypothetical protein
MADLSMNWLKLCFLASAALVAASCGSKSASLHPVRGRVLYLGQPTPGAIVVFHPVGNDDPAAPRPSGKVQEDGSFTLSTFKPGDGAPAGDYLVAIAWIDQNAQVDPAAEEKPNRLPSWYADPRTSQLNAKVQKGNNDLPPFELRR